MTKKQKNELFDSILELYTVDEDIRSYFTDTNLSTEERIAKIKALEETTGDTAAYFGNSRQAAIEMLEAGNYNTDELDKRLDECRAGHVKRLIADVGELSDAYLAKLPELFQEKMPGMSETDRNKLADKIAEQARMVLETQDASRKIAEMREAVKGDEKLSAELAEHFGGRNTGEASEGLQAATKTSPDEIKKLKDVYKYSVEGKLESGIPELDAFLAIIQPAINQLVITLHRPKFAVIDTLNKYVFGTKDGPSVLSTHLEDRAIANDDAKYAKGDTNLNFDEEKYNKAFRLKDKNKVLDDSMNKSDVLIDKLNEFLIQEKEDFEGYRDAAEGKDENSEEYKAWKAREKQYDANIKGGKYEERKTLFDMSQPSKETLQTLDWYARETMKKISEEHSSGSFKDANKARRTAFLRISSILEKCNPNNDKKFTQDFVDKWAMDWADALANEKASNLAEDRDSYVSRMTEQEEYQKYVTTMAASMAKHQGKE